MQQADDVRVLGRDRARVADCQSPFQRSALLLYASTIGLSAFLLFLVQPIVARQLLPWFGGSAAVWTTCVRFFQVVLLAGYMRILTPPFVARFAGRLLNIHPSLLPAFTGLDTHRRALDAGCRVHGCTVHFVTAELDHGPIIAQAAVPILDDDDESRLAARVLAQENRLLPAAVRWCLDGGLEVRGMRVVNPVAAAASDAALRSPEPA